MHFDYRTALTSLGSDFGVPDLQLDDDGFACLSTENYDLCFLEDAGDRSLLVFAQICLLPTDPDARFLSMLLEGNFFARETAGAALGIDQDRGWVVLSRSIDTEGMDAHRFRTLVIGFMEAAEYWSMKVLDYFEGHLDDDAPASTLASAPAPAQAIRG